MKRKEEMAIQPYRPEKARDDQLRDDIRIFTAWVSRLLKGKEFKYSYSEILNHFAIPAFQEVWKREAKGKEVWSSLSQKDWTPAAKKLIFDVYEKATQDALKLVSPHAEMIHKGEKTAIVKSRKYNLSHPYFLTNTQGDVFGYIRLSPPRKISSSEFERLAQTHRISREEALDWWGRTDNLYYYKIRDFLKFPKPKRYTPKKEAQVVQKKIKVFQLPSEEEILKTPPEQLTNKGLAILHRLLHKYWTKGNERILNAHILLVQEMRKRGLEHRPLDELDAETEGWVLSNPLTLEQVLSFFKPFTIRKPVAFLVGSLVVNGWGRDIDILIPEDYKPLARILEFRISQMFPESLRGRLHFVYDSAGPFTCHVPLFSLEMVRLPGTDVIPMAEEAEK